MVDRGMSGRSGSNMWMNGPSFLFCRLYYASGEKGKRRLSIASPSIGSKQNVSSVEACKGPKSQTKIASEGTHCHSSVCVCVFDYYTPINPVQGKHWKRPQARQHIWRPAKQHRCHPGQRPDQCRCCFVWRSWPTVHALPFRIQI